MIKVLPVRVPWSPLWPEIDLRAMIDVENVNDAGAFVDPVDDATGAARGLSSLAGGSAVREILANTSQISTRLATLQRAQALGDARHSFCAAEDLQGHL